jgi:hypothetical protein
MFHGGDEKPTGVLSEDGATRLGGPVGVEAAIWEPTSYAYAKEGLGKGGISNLHRIGSSA